MKVGIHSHSNPSSTTSVWITFLAVDHHWDDIITETHQGTVPTNLTWSSEFSPVGEYDKYITIPSQTVAIPPLKTYVGYVEFSNWQQEYAPNSGLFLPPAIQTHYESNGMGGFIFQVTRENNIRKNHEYKHKFEDYGSEDPGSGMWGTYVYLCY